jgi:hypothetical protein
MKTAIKTFAYAIAISIAAISCSNSGIAVDDVNNNIESSSSSNFDSSSSFENSSSSKEHVILEKMPVMDSTVVSYKHIVNLGPLNYERGLITTDQDTLKSWFPHIFDKKQISECNYFAIHYTGASSFHSYLVLQDMNLYSVQVSRVDGDGMDCIMTTDIIRRSMLICDDAAGSIKNSLDPDNTGVYRITGTYTDPDWYCNTEKDPFFNSKLDSSSSLGFSSSSSIENSSSSKEHVILEKMPVMDSAVVSYKRILKLGTLDYEHGFITDQDTLKSWFPHIFDKELTSECNYFAIYFTGSGSLISYFVLQDMNLYLVQTNPNRKDCPPITTDIAYFSMLICDDAAGSVKNSLDPDNTGVYSITGTYTDPDWYCYGGRNPFF